MNCDAAQQHILERLDTRQTQPTNHDLQQHLLSCANCAVFYNTQMHLDLQLRTQLIAPRLSSAFQSAIQANVGGRPHDVLPEWIADAAFVAGSSIGLALCWVLLPLTGSTILVTGVSLAIVAYLLEMLLLAVSQPSME